jgi:hypothetical protein
MAEQPTPNKYAHLPDPIRPEDMVTSLDVQPVQPEKDDYWREVEWMLRTSGLV